MPTATLELDGKTWEIPVEELKAILDHAEVNMHTLRRAALKRDKKVPEIDRDAQVRIETLRMFHKELI